MQQAMSKKNKEVTQLKKEVKQKKKIQEEIKDLELQKSQTMKKYRDKVTSKWAERNTPSDTTNDTEHRTGKGSKAKGKGRSSPQNEDIFPTKRKRNKQSPSSRDLISHKERMLWAKEEKWKKREEEWLVELQAIRQENQAHMSEAWKN